MGRIARLKNLAKKCFNKVLSLICRFQSDNCHKSYKQASPTRATVNSPTNLIPTVPAMKIPVSVKKVHQDGENGL